MKNGSPYAVVVAVRVVIFIGLQCRQTAVGMSVVLAAAVAMPGGELSSSTQRFAADGHAGS